MISGTVVIDVTSKSTVKDTPRRLFGQGVVSFALVDCGPNAGAHLLPEAAATQERRLEAVRCSALFGAGLGREPSAGVPSPHERPMTQECAADNCSGSVISACDVLAQ